MTYRIHPPMPVFDALVEKYGSEYVFDHFFDENGNPKPDAPDELKRETKLVRGQN